MVFIDSATQIFLVRNESFALVFNALMWMIVGKACVYMKFVALNLFGTYL